MQRSRWLSRTNDRGRGNPCFASTGAGDASLCGADLSHLAGRVHMKSRRRRTEHGVGKEFAAEGPQMANA